MYAMNMKEALSTLAVFSEMFDIIEWMEDLLFGKSDSNQSGDSENKKETSTTWIPEFKETLHHETRQDENIASKWNDNSSATINNNALTDDFLTKDPSSDSVLKTTPEIDVDITTQSCVAETTSPFKTVKEYVIPQKECNVSSKNTTGIDADISAQSYATKTTDSLKIEEECVRSEVESNSNLSSKIATGNDNEITITEVNFTKENNVSKLNYDFDQKQNSHATTEVISENDKRNLSLKSVNICDIKTPCENSPNTTTQNLKHSSPIVTEQLLLSVKLSSTLKDKRTEKDITTCSATEIQLTKGNTRDFLENSDSIIQKNQLVETDDTEEIRGIKKFTTSSWNLEAIMDSLYKLPEFPESYKVFDQRNSKRLVDVLSQGSFCSYPEGKYTITLEESLHVTQELEPTNLLTIPLNYGEVSVIDRTTLKLDNRLGRCLYFRCDSHNELQELKEDLESYCRKHWESECINLVHYPLKCHQNVVIIDLGSCSTRAGILMDEPTLPFIFFPSVCATDKITGHQVFGKEALQTEVRQNSYLSFPVRPSIKIIKHSIDINLVGGLFKKIFTDLRVDPTKYTIQVCLPRSLSINDQRSLVKLLLEELNVQSVSLTYQALLTLYAHNVSTGIVVDIGDRMDILPVVDGFIVENGVTRLPYGGQRLIHHMKHALAEKHISLSNDIDAFVVQYIAEKLAYIAENYKRELEIATQYPDIIKKSTALQTFAKDDNCAHYAILDDARFKIPEGLFQPELWGLDSPGVHQLVQKAIQATSVDVRKKIAENIYVSGGVTLIPGFVERLLKELDHLNKPRILPKVIASNYRYHCTYIGACKFARMEVFPTVCITLEEYTKNELSSLKKFVLCF